MRAPAAEPGAGISVVAVVVTYRPRPEALSRNLGLVGPQVHSVCIVDNGTPSIEHLIRKLALARCRLIQNSENVGLARAQNLGIEYALSIGARYILLLDQDSEPAPDLVARLLEGLTSGEYAGEMTAAAAPLLFEAAAQSKSRFMRIGRYGVKRVGCKEDAEIIATDIAIASGMLIRSSAMHRVGPMEDGLFIDQVDTEWCLRARALGLRLIGVCAARMTHRFGDRPGRRFLGRQFFVRSPARHYFFVRNTILLLGRPYSPTAWRIWQCLHLLLFMTVVAATCTPRRNHLRALWRGLVDGVGGRVGPLPAELESAAAPPNRSE